MPDITLKDLILNNLEINLEAISSFEIYKEEKLLCNLLEWICPVFQVEINSEKSYALVKKCVEVYKTVLIHGVSFNQ